MNHKAILIEQAIQTLQAIIPEQIETVQINSTEYDDGSLGLTIDLTYPAQDIEEISFAGKE